MLPMPIAADLAVRRTREQALSALPDAPVVDDTPSPTPRARTRGRLQLAQVLRTLADRVEPATTCPTEQRS
jgi:hypothetical protein